jgi:preprotein translocase subunit SecA
MPVIDTITNAVRQLLGTTNEAVLRRIWPTVRKVTAQEARMRALDDTGLRALAAELRQRVAGGASLDDVAVEALALVREAADRRIGMWAALNPAKGFPDEAWGNAKPAVDAVRAQLAAGTAPWELDLPASVYDRVRACHPNSVPPFRMRGHDVQVLGALVLHQGKIAEMRTGEGKTLVASFTAFLNALSGKGVHIVTVNDYLAGRDAAWNTPTLRFLGVSVGAIQSQMPQHVRKAVYEGDVVYGTNSEFGFDYLRDNLARSLDEQVQRRRSFAIVDEVDSILIDEARVPLIISGPAMNREQFYRQANDVAAQMVKDVDFAIDIKDRTVTLTEEGTDKATKLFGVENLYDGEGMQLPHFLDNALKAYHLYTRDKEYLVSAGQVRIVDEHTGRVLEGRRWSDGLHQAVEAKEGVEIREENQTYATITLQNFFRLYGKLAGMTGTAMTEANEFNAIYKLEVVAIPPNRPVQRADLADLIYGTESEKFEAIIKEVEDLHAVGQPVLVGSISVEVSERLSERFTRKGIPHNVLNAKQHAREAEIVAGAGQFGAVTIATNMAGRGTDIVLGGIDAAAAFKHWQAHGLMPKKLTPESRESEIDEAVLDLWATRWLDEAGATKLRGQPATARLAAINKQRKLIGFTALPLPSSFRTRVDVRQLGGLRILGSERHDSRRIDNQLRGRSGRQGDPGSSRFYLSLDDDLMKRFAQGMWTNAMRSMGLNNGQAIESGMVSRQIEKAQKRVEEYHYGIRKNLLEYDQVANGQRTIIYRQRQAIIEGKDCDKTLLGLYRDSLDDLIQDAATDGTRGEDLAKRIATQVAEEYGITAPPFTDIPVKDGGAACLTHILSIIEQGVAARRQELGEVFDHLLRFVMLETIDRRWKDHLYAMDHLRHAIGLESYAQKDPRLRFKEEGYRQFGAMNRLIRQDIVRLFFRLQVQAQPPVEEENSSNPVEDHLAAGGFQPRGALGTDPKSETASFANPRHAVPASLALAPDIDDQPIPSPDGEAPQHDPNAPCPCGSGAPYKRCHGRNRR